MYIQVTFISLFLATLVHILAAGVDFGLVGPILLFLMWQRQWRCWWCLAKVIHVFPYLCGWMNIHWAALRLHPRLPCWQRGYHQSATWWPWRSWHWTDDVDGDNGTGNFVDDIKFNDDSLTVIFWNAQLSIYKRSRYDVAWCINLIIKMGVFIQRRYIDQLVWSSLSINVDQINLPVLEGRSSRAIF